LKLQAYLLRQLVVALAFALGGLCFIVLPAITVSAVHKLGGVNISALLGFLPLVAVGLVPYLVPMSFLLAVVSTFGRLAQDNEWTALRMAGIHPARTLIPGLLLASALALSTHWVLATVAPEWMFQQRAYKREAAVNAFRSLNPGRTEISVGDFYLNCTRREGNSWYDALLQLPATSSRGELRVVADRADIAVVGDYLELHFEKLRVVDGALDGRRDELGLRVPLDELIERAPKQRNQPKWMTSVELESALRGGELEPREASLYRYEIHWRHALASTYFVFLLLGLPTGVLLRRGTLLLALAAAVGYAFVYYLLFVRLGKELAVHEAVPSALAAWATNALALGVGGLLMLRVCRQ
jgi:lipopolysaccharide export LptBFGC system permease protein LptF